MLFHLLPASSWLSLALDFVFSAIKPALFEDKRMSSKDVKLWEQKANQIPETPAQDRRAWEPKAVGRSHPSPPLGVAAAALKPKPPAQPHTGEATFRNPAATPQGCRAPSPPRGSTLPWPLQRCATSPENRAEASRATGKVWSVYGKDFPVLRVWFLSPKKGSQHLRSLALGIPSWRLGAEPTGRDSIRKKNGGGLGWGGGPSQGGGRGTFSVHVPPTAISSTLGVKSDREREISSQKLCPVTQARGREGI